MFSADLGGAPPVSYPAATDPPFQKVALLLHGDDTNGAQNNTFVDSSSNNFTITRTGNVAQGTFSPFSLAEGQWSNYFDGTGDYLTAPNDTSLDMGSSSFTVEGWFYVGTVTGTYIPIVTRFNGSAIAASNLQYLVYQSGSSLAMKAYSSTTVTITFSSALTVGNWYHFALVRDGSTISGYLNGVKNATTGTITGALYTGTWLTYIGYYNEGGTSYYHTGYTSNIRIVKGTAVYTSNFTPSTSPLTAISGTSLLTCQSNRFKDNSSNNFTISRNGDTKVTAFSPFAPSAAYSAGTNGGSGYFDGAGDYLSAADSASLNMGSSDFTIETFVYINALPTTTQISLINKDGKSGVTWAQYALGITSSGRAYAQMSYVPSAAGSPTASITGASTVNVGEWNHLALTRTGTTAKLWVNGVQDGTTSTVPSTLNNGARALLSGYEDSQPSAFYFNGYLSNQRIVKGSAVYTANFTPPTAPLTSVTNTQLLLNCTNAGIYDNSGKNDIETVGNAQISTSVKKYGTGSMYFDGTGDYLSINPNDLFVHGAGDWTIEMWVYPTSTKSNMRLFEHSDNKDNLDMNVGGVGRISYWNGSNSITSTSAVLTINDWCHVACVRASGTVKVYANGYLALTHTSPNTTAYRALYVGGKTSYWFQGYIDDLRITKGQALYTSNFTPPTQAFPNV